MVTMSNTKCLPEVYKAHLCGAMEVHSLHRASFSTSGMSWNGLCGPQLFLPDLTNNFCVRIQSNPQSKVSSNSLLIPIGIKRNFGLQIYVQTVYIVHMHISESSKFYQHAYTLNEMLEVKTNKHVLFIYPCFFDHDGGLKQLMCWEMPCCCLALWHAITDRRSADDLLLLWRTAPTPSCAISRNPSQPTISINSPTSEGAEEQLRNDMHLLLLPWQPC